MAMDRTWQYAYNTANPGATTWDLANYAIWFLKSTMLGTGTGLTWTDQSGAGITPSGGWTVWGSCDGSGGAGSFVNNSTTDKWTTTWAAVANATTAPFVHATAGSNHSWIALQNSHNTNYKCTIDMVSASANIATVTFGYGAFSNGSATACATIATPFKGTNFDLLQFTETPYASAWRQHGCLSTTGDFWALGSKNGSGYFWSAVGAAEMLNQPSWYTTYPLWTAARYNTTSPVLNAGIANVAPVNGLANAMSRAGRAATSVKITMPSLPTAADYLAQNAGVGSANFVSEPDPNGGAFQWPCHVYIWDGTALRCDYAGRVPDMWIADGLRVDGDVTPAIGTLNYMVVGDFWLPTNAVPTL